MRNLPGLFCCVLLASSPLVGEEAKSPCGPEARQFDFWVGDWEVTQPDGKPAGTNDIRLILDGCVLQENWRGAAGSAGSSFTFYNPGTGKWQQFWIWRNGTPLELSGGYSEGKMVMTGETEAADGRSVRNRITWYDNDDGTVRQHWEQSIDGGKSWSTAFDGLYRKKG